MKRSQLKQWRRQATELSWVEMKPIWNEANLEWNRIGVSASSSGAEAKPESNPAWVLNTLNGTELDQSSFKAKNSNSKQGNT